MALIAQAAGRKDQADANLVFNQSLVLAMIAMLVTLVGGYLVIGPYMRSVGADEATANAGTVYLRWFLPGLALQFALIAMGSALRGTGLAKPGMVVQVATVVLNAILAPVLVAGWGTGKPLGIAGAGLATSLAIAVGVVMMVAYFARLEKYVGVDATLLRPDPATWKRILKIGVPPGGEFALMFLFLALVYFIIRAFGPAAQAGFGVGSRVMQAIFLPAMAVAFAVAPLAGQNAGARLLPRVRETFDKAALIGSAIMAVLTLFCHWRPDLLVGFFTKDAEVVRIGSEFLRIISWNFVAQGLIFTCAGMFQALGHTLPPLYCTATRVTVFASVAYWLSTRPGFELHEVWYVSVATVTLQAILIITLLLRDIGRRTREAVPTPA
jgi:putative MATE family efflux protein